MCHFTWVLSSLLSSTRLGAFEISAKVGSEIWRAFTFLERPRHTSGFTDLSLLCCYFFGPFILACPNFLIKLRNFQKRCRKNPPMCEKEKACVCQLCVFVYFEEAGKVLICLPTRCDCLLRVMALFRFSIAVKSFPLSKTPENTRWRNLISIAYINSKPTRPWKRSKKNLSEPCFIIINAFSCAVINFGYCGGSI